MANSMAKGATKMAKRCKALQKRIDGLVDALDTLEDRVCQYNDDGNTHDAEQLELVVTLLQAQLTLAFFIRKPLLPKKVQ